MHYWSKFHYNGCSLQLALKMKDYNPNIRFIESDIMIQDFLMITISIIITNTFES